MEEKKDLTDAEKYQRYLANSRKNVEKWRNKNRALYNKRQREIQQAQRDKKKAEKLAQAEKVQQ